MLAKRLARHASAMSAGAVSALLAQNAMTACAPASVVSSTIEAARLIAAGQTAATGLISAQVVALADGVMRNMMLTKLKSVVSLCVLALPLCAITGAVVGTGREDRDAGKKTAPKALPEKERAAKPAKDSKSADELTALLKTRVALAQKGYSAAKEGLRLTKRSGNVLVYDATKPEKVYHWSVRWLQAERDMNPKRADQIAALEAHLKRMTELEEAVKMLARDLLPRSAEWDAEWYRLEAQLWLAKAKTK
jgi:hypothetical protein